MSNNSRKVPNERRLGFGKACFNCRKKKHRCDGKRPVCFSCRHRGLLCEYANDMTQPLLEWWGPTTISTRTPRLIACSSDGVAPADRPRGNPRGRVQELLQTTEGIEGFLKGAEVCLGSRNIDGSIGGLQNPSHEEGRGTSVRRDSFISAGVNLVEPNGYIGDSSTLKYVSKIRPELQSTTDSTQSLMMVSWLRPGTSATTVRAYKIQTVDLEDSAVPVTLISPSVLEDEGCGHDVLPPRQVADELIDAYFERVHVLHPFLHEGSFRAHYEQLWADPDFSRPRETSWLALANLVFAYGCEFCRARQTDEFDERALAFIERAKSIILSLVFRNADLPLVQALLLLCHYVQGTLALNDCWNFAGLMIRNAISIGLHVNPIDDGTSLPVEKESRKRLWWGCVVLDRTLCFRLGRPPSIRSMDADGVDLPMEVDDQYIVDTSLVTRQPLGRPSRISFFVQTIKLSHIMDCVLARVYLANAKIQKRQDQTLLSHRTDESSVLGNTFLLDGQLQTWWNEMPPYLREEPALPDGIDFQRQRRVMRLRFLQIRVLLQRPIFLLFSKDRINDQFMRAGAIASSRVCVSAAQETIQLIHQDYNRQLLNSLWYNLLSRLLLSLQPGLLITCQQMCSPLWLFS